MLEENDISPNNSLDDLINKDEVAHKDIIKSEYSVVTSGNQIDALNSFVSKKTIVFTLLLTIVCVVSVFIGFKLFWFDKNIINTNQMLKIKDSNVQSNDSVKRPFRTIRKLATSSAQARVLVLKNKPNDPIVDLDEMHVDDNCLDIAFWNGDVVTMESGNITLTNIKTKNQRVIKALEYLKDGFMCYFQYNSKLSIIDNKLFIGINDGKGLEGGLFVMSESNQATPAAVLSAKRIISKIDDQLLVDCKMGKIGVGGQGPGYCVLDPLSLTIKPVVHSNGTHYIGQDSNKRLLFVGQTKDYTAKYIIAVPDGKWDSYEGLIAEENIPTGYSTFTNGYSSAINLAVFQGNGLLLINLDTKELTTTAYPDSFKTLSSAPDIYLSGDNTFCIDYGEYVDPHQYAYNASSKSFIDYKQSCTKQKKGGVDKIIEKLPSEYNIVTLEVPKKIYDMKEIPIADPLPNGWEETN